jgi:hypothetical protein
MDSLDHLQDRQTCGLCNRPICFSDDFCSTCRRALPAGRRERDVVLEAEAQLLTAAAVTA